MKLKKKKTEFLKNDFLFILKQDGKYLIVKDPNKPVIRLYDIPDSTFESDEESDEEDENDGKFTHILKN